MINPRFGAIVLAAGLCLTLPAASARATVLTFDDVPALFVDPNSGQVLDGYENLAWYDFYVAPSPQPVEPGNPGNPPLFNGADTYSQVSTLDTTSSFDFTSAYITVVAPAAGQDGLWMQVIGFDQATGLPVGDGGIPFFVSASTPQLWVFNYTDIDVLEFAALEPDQATPCDECTFGIADEAPTPEPAALVLLGTGLTGLAAAKGWRRRKR